MGDITLREVYTEMQKGFDNVYVKIDGICLKYDSTLDEHNVRIAALDTAMQVRKAVNGVKCKAAQEGRDYWKWIIRGVSVSCILAVGGFILTKIIIPALTVAS